MILQLHHRSSNSCMHGCHLILSKMACSFHAPSSSLPKHHQSTAAALLPPRFYCCWCCCWWLQSVACTQCSTIQTMSHALQPVRLLASWCLRGCAVKSSPMTCRWGPQQQWQLWPSSSPGAVAVQHVLAAVCHLWLGVEEETGGTHIRRWLL